MARLQAQAESMEVVLCTGAASPVGAVAAALTRTTGFPAWAWSSRIKSTAFSASMIAVALVLPET